MAWVSSAWNTIGCGPNGRTRFVANESRGVRLAGGQTVPAALYCLARALMGGSASAGQSWVVEVRQVCPAALTVESGASAVFRQARLAERAEADAVCRAVLTADSDASLCSRHLTNPASNRADLNQVAAVHLVCPVDQAADSDASVCLCPGLSAGLASADSAGLVFPACSDLPDVASAFPDLDCPVFRVCRASRALVCLAMDGGRREDSPDVQVEVPDDLAADSAVGESPSCHGIPDDWPTRSVADDTNNVADDKGFPSRSNSRDCSRPASLPNSIPNRPIPRGGYLQSGR